MNQKTKILYYSAGEEIGGAEIYLEQLIQGLNSEQFHISLLTTGSSSIEPWLTRLQPMLDQIIRIKKGKFFQPAYLSQLVRYFNEADVLHLNLGNAVGYKVALFAAGSSRARRQIATIHLAGSYPQPEHVKQRVARKALKYFYKNIDKIITVSEANQRNLTNYYELPAQKIQVIHNGISVEKYTTNESSEKSRTLLNFPISKKIIAVVGRLHEQKGHIYLIRAAQKIIDNIPDCHFIFVGDGELRESLQKLVGDLELTAYFTFVGFRTDIPRILNAIDLFILPSLDEGLPLVLLEGMAAGKPVIATDVGGVAELVQNNRSGVLIPSGQVEAIVNSVVNIFQLKGLMKRIGIQAHDFVINNFSHENMLKKTYENYE